jgi:hypothetical protein
MYISTSFSKLFWVQLAAGVSNYIHVHPVNGNQPLKGGLEIAMYQLSWFSKFHRQDPTKKTANLCLLCRYKKKKIVSWNPDRNWADKQSHYRGGAETGKKRPRRNGSHPRNHGEQGSFCSTGPNFHHFRRCLLALALPMGKRIHHVQLQLQSLSSFLSYTEAVTAERAATVERLSMGNRCLKLQLMHGVSASCLVAIFYTEQWSAGL